MKTYDAVLLLGLKLNPDGTPTEELQGRIQKAAGFMTEKSVSLVIPCGGQTEGTPLSEAAVMALELEKLGIAPEQILPEDASLFTVENIQNAKALLKKRGVTNPRVLLVTSDYHMFRAAFMARSMGFKVKRCPSKTPSGPAKNKRRKMELFYLINYITGWETGRRKRPAWYDKAVKKLQK